MDDLERLLQLVHSGDREAAKDVFAQARRRGDKAATQMAGLLLYPTEAMYLRSVLVPAWKDRDARLLEFASTCLGVCLDVATVTRLDALRSRANRKDDSPHMTTSLDIVRTLQGALAKDTHWDSPSRKTTKRDALGTHRTIVLATRQGGTLVCGISSADVLNPHPGHFWDDLNPWGWTASSTGDGEFLQRLQKWASDTRSDRTTIDIL